MGFVVAFRGRRDAYQVPIALAEVGLLDTFITDQFCRPAARRLAKLLPAGVAERIERRYDPALPQTRVRTLGALSLCEHLARAAKVPPAAVYDLFDPGFGRAAKHRARAGRSDLFLYSAYAWNAFRARYSHAPRKILFQYHPHVRTEHALLAGDRGRSRSLGVAFDGRLESSDMRSEARRQGDEAWRLADRVVCASSFTKRSLVEAGADPARIVVAPYGVPPMEPPPTGAEAPVGDSFKALFVGSGLQRKGLHHLLAAWDRARLPSGSSLTIVSRVVDPGLSPLLQERRGVRLIRGVSEAELERLYRTSTLFVMPSLVEGFGQVYLEALSRGLPVLGTENTCCPDLGDERDGVFLTPAGDIDALAAALEGLAARLPGDLAIRAEATSCAGRFTWERFRASIQALALEPAAG